MLPSSLPRGMQAVLQTLLGSFALQQSMLLFGGYGKNRRVFEDIETKEEVLWDNYEPWVFG